MFPDLSSHSNRNGIQMSYSGYYCLLQKSKGVECYETPPIISKGMYIVRSSKNSTKNGKKHSSSLVDEQSMVKQMNELVADISNEPESSELEAQENVEKSEEINAASSASSGAPSANTDGMGKNGDNNVGEEA